MNHVNTSLYLSQSYQDAWSDYQRSLRSPSFPVWDYIILTASNQNQAKSFQMQIESRREYLPTRTNIAIIPDEGGVRVGSGGATLSVIKYLHAQEGTLENLRVLVIHSGGDSKRVPQYSALGKLFSPVPHELPDGRSSTLFDEFLIAMSAMPGRIKAGMLLLSGDVLLLFNPLLVDWSGNGAAVMSFKEDVETGKDHGVFLRSPSGLVQRFLHKQSVEMLKNVGAVNENGMVDIDTGAVLFGADILSALWGLISKDGRFDEGKYSSLVNNKVRLSLYGDFQYPLAIDSTLEQFYLESPEGEYTHELYEARTAVWNALRPYQMKLLRLAPAKFIHFGTTKEILSLMEHGINEYKELGWSRNVNCSMRMASGYNSVISSHSFVEESSYLEVSYVHGSSSVGKNCVLSHIDIYNQKIPDNVVLHGLKQSNGKFVVRIYGIEDNPKENKLFGMELTGNLWNEGTPHILWFAKLYPEKDTIDEAVESALTLYKSVIDGKQFEYVEDWKSLHSGFNDANPEAILAWNKRMTELVAMNKIQALIDNKKPAMAGKLPVSLTKIQKEWLETHLLRLDYLEKMRLHYYVGYALKSESEIGKAFSDLSEAILATTLEGLRERQDARIIKDKLEVRLPLRVNWGGGWSDTPPYCNENGGTVLNAAVTLSNESPVKVSIQRLDEKKIIFESADLDVYEEFDTIEPLQSVGDPFDSFVLQKAALLACGIIPRYNGDLGTVLTRLGGGIWMDTEVINVPKGSGLGTSSILAAACVKALFEFLGIPHTNDDIYATVLVMEQIMSTGGGWQDQVGGLTEGVKMISSHPGLKQELKVDHLNLSMDVKKELNKRFALIYTGQRRLARNLLRDVVGRYIGNEPDTVFALNEIQRLAVLMKFELERGNIEAFAELLNQHWELSKIIDAGSTNTLIDQIFDSVDDLLAGRMICGAGGGGFLQVLLKAGVTRADLENRLKTVFSDTEIRVWDCELLW